MHEAIESAGSERETYPALAPRASTCDVSIIIPSWNTAGLLRECLASIYAETQGIDFEVLVVDNASADESCAMVEAEFPHVRLLRNSENKGFARACNQGMRNAEGRFLLLLNSDTRIVGNAIVALLGKLEAEPKAGLAGCALLNGDGSLQPSCGRFPRLLSTPLRGFGLQGILQIGEAKRRCFSNPFLSYEEHSQSQPVDWIAGACMLARREAVEQAGMLDEQFFLFAEEWDWCYRITASGWRIDYHADINVVHVGQASWTKTDADRQRAVMSSQQYFYIKHYGPSRARIFKVLSFINSLMKTVLWAGLVVPFPSRRGYLLGRARLHLWSLGWCLRAAPGRMLQPRDLESEASPAPRQEVNARNP